MICSKREAYEIIKEITAPLKKKSTVQDNPVTFPKQIIIKKNHKSKKFNIS